ncbi:hypothetical protein PORY_002258 [Pneumocystis oryctolagi]|uniref:Uncharacterized protein n=1 Tax=Pneumocystis oryctolagi TaxID=42067 RepID=A0ACB7CBI3_9ASCO|nr:hypothetical protein PORY_002258 [Pneumocystis oryctolagi]
MVILNETKSWTSLRSQLISLESQTEVFFLDFVSVPFDSQVDFKERIEDLFNKREASILALSRLLDPDYGGDTIKQHYVQRHKEILEKHKKEFQKMNKKKELEQSYSESELIKKNIKKHKNTINESESDYFLQESSRLDNSHNMTDQILSQAYAIRDDFEQQKYILESMNHRISKAISHVPGINLLISRINTKKKRNNLILSLVISICIITTYFIM